MRRGATKHKLWYPVLRPQDYGRGEIIWLELAPHRGWYEVLSQGIGEIHVRRLTWREALGHRLRLLLRR